MHPRGRRSDRFLLVCGYLAITLASYVAFSSPPEGYEVSIYTGTPLAFWLAISLAMGCSLVISFTASKTPERYLGYFLGGSAMTAIVGLPLLRGYTFYGHGDPLTHLGWLRDVDAGKLAVSELFYPGLHSVSVAIQQLTGNTLAHSLQLAVLCLTITAFLFVPLIVYTTIRDRNATPIALFSAFLMLPITNLATYNRAHPYTQTIFFSTLVVYLALKFVFEPRETLLTPYGFLLGLGSVAIVLFHPLQTLHILLLFGGVVVVQFVFRGNERIAGHKPLFYHTVFLGAVFFAWIAGTDTFESASRTYPRAILGYFQGGSDAGAAVASQSGSLADIGVSASELVFKLFGVSLLFVSLASLFVLVNVVRRLRAGYDERTQQQTVTGLAALAVAPALVLGYFERTPRLLTTTTGLILLVASLLVGAGLALLTALFLLSRRSPEDVVRGTETTNGVVTYIVVGGALTVPLFVLFFIGNISELYFRVLGQLLMLTTILGAIAIFWLYYGLDERLTPALSSIGLVLLFALLIPVSVAGLYASPYIYQANQQVTGASLQGYDTTFDHRERTVPVAGTRTGPARYSHATQGVADGQDYSRSIDGANFSRLPAATPGPAYLTVTAYNRDREIQAFKELRYSRAQFRSLDNQPGVDILASTGGFRLYRAR